MLGDRQHILEQQFLDLCSQFPGVRSNSLHTSDKLNIVARTEASGLSQCHTPDRPAASCRVVASCVLYWSSCPESNLRRPPPTTDPPLKPTHQPSDDHMPNQPTDQPANIFSQRHASQPTNQPTYHQQTTHQPINHHARAHARTHARTRTHVARTHAHT